MGYKKKQKWVKPKLTILTSKNREEAVLTGCKIHGGAINGPTFTYSQICDATYYPFCRDRCYAFTSS